MRKIFAGIMAMVLLCMAAGCQKTPESPIVVGKGDGQLEEKIIAGKDNAVAPEDIPESGTHIKETIPHDTLPIKIIIDADVQTVDGKPIPAVKVRPHKFAQEEVAKMTGYILGDRYFAAADPQADPIDLKIAMSIKEWEKMVEEARTNPPEEGNADIAYMEERLAEYRKEYLTAKKLSEFPEASRTLGKIDEYYEEGIFGCFEIDGRLFRLSVDNDESGKNSTMWLFQYGADQREASYSLKERGEDLKGLLYKSSLRIAEDAAKGIGAYDAGLRLAYAEGREYPEKPEDNHYQFIYTREIGGVLCGYDSTDAETESPYKHEEDIPDGFVAAQPWAYEKLVINVDKNGLQSFEWSAPYEVMENVSENTPLLPFKDTMDCFSKMAFIKHSYIEEELKWVYEDADGNSTGSVGSIEIHIRRISLSLMRVQGGKDFILIPVWDFYGYKDILAPDGTHYGSLAKPVTEEDREYFRQMELKKSFMTINAIDGSVIDRNYGY